MHKTLFQSLKLRPGSSVLDLGSGDGKQNAYMRKGHVYQGIDLLSSNKHVLRGDFVPWLKKTSGKYDLILAEFSLQQVPRSQLWQTVRLIKNRLEQGGFFFLTSFNEGDAIGPSFSQREFWKMAEGCRIVLWSRKQGFDQKRRHRSVSQILLQKPK